MTDADSYSQRAANDVIVADLWQQAREHEDGTHAIAEFKPEITGSREAASAGDLKRKGEPEKLASNTRARVDSGHETLVNSSRRKRSLTSPAFSSLLARRRIRQTLRAGSGPPGGPIAVLSAHAIPTAPAGNLVTALPTRGTPDRRGLSMRLGGAADERLFFPVLGEGLMGVERMRNRWDETITIGGGTTWRGNSARMAPSSNSGPWSTRRGRRRRSGPVKGGNIEKSNRNSNKPRWEVKVFPKREIEDGHVEALRRYIISNTGRLPVVAPGRNVVSGVSFIFEYTSFGFNTC